ncbi:hypothetical protein niasHT_005337 [Heterodera trifolii]|uniref:Unconventional myosin-If n=1 Tax=Heterodera trifolii TaxID=157864 RepID=A0ABD2M1W8_9BILA
MARHWQARNTTAGVEDMVLLRQLSDEAIVENLRKRLSARAMFTYIGPVLVSVNPFTQVAKFDEQEMEQYQGAAQYENAPHIFALADAMFRNMLIDRERQCVIVSGESGAGKTVCARHIMSYLAFSSGGGQRVQRLKETILKSNPLLEAFGNAATLRNWNSSRFGKYVEIVFAVSGEPLGGQISSFLLEKSRVAQTAPGERNFHIFYQMLAGADDQLSRSLGLATPDYFNYLNCSDCFQAEGTDDKSAFAETLDAMEVIGLDDQSRLQCLTVVAATLHIGNIAFVENDDGFASVADDEYLKFPAFLLGLTVENIKEKLTTRQMQSKWGSTHEQVDVRFNTVKAAYTRDAWAKALYTRLFDFLVASVNCALNVDAKRNSFDISVAVLDIYGFEVFERNGFEQFCINFVNEKLQQIFIELTLKAEQEEYQSEGLKWTPIEFFNNKIVCELIEAKRPRPGIMFLLDDTSLQLHGQNEGADKKFLSDLKKQHEGHEHFRSGADSFVVRHYAGEVVYQIEGFCDRNMDILHVDLVQLMQNSENEFMRQLFAADCVSNENGNNKKPTSASTKIRSQANHLMDSLMRCVPHYVRCIKPNERKRALEFNEQRVLHQVRYLGLCENIRVRRAGFVYRRPFERFLWRYAILCAQTWPQWHGEPKKGCELICRSAELADTEFRLGHTKIFVKNPESLFLLEEGRERKFDAFARVIQRAFRRFTAKKHLTKQKDEAVSLLQGRKERCRFSMERRFVADYIGMDQRPGLQAIIGRRERLYFAAAVVKFDRRFRASRIDLLLTAKYLFLVGREPLKSGVNKGKLVEVVKRQIPLTQLQAVTVSTLQDDLVLLSVADSYCSLVETPLKTELLAALHKRCKERVGCPPLPLQFSDRFVVHLKQAQKFPLAIRLIDGDQRFVEFRHADGEGERTIGQTVKTQLKTNGRLMVVTVLKGLPPESKPTGQRQSVDILKNGQMLHSHQQQQKRISQVQQRQHMDQPPAQNTPNWQTNGNGTVPQAPQHALARVLQQRGVISQQNQQQPTDQSHRPAPQRPPPLKPKPQVKPRGQMLRTLYAYDAQDTDELSFVKDQMIELVKRDDSGWWQGRLDGCEGLFPANYVTEA